MGTTSYDGIYKNYNSDLYVWMKVIKKIDGIPIPEV